jgi:hypothetical protein
VDSRGDPLDRETGQLAVERRDETIAPRPVGGTGAAEMPRIVAAREELGHGELVERGREVVRKAFYALELVNEIVGRDDPTEPQRGGERLRRRPEVDDLGRGEPLKGPHRLAVVAKLRVVVVLYDEAVGPLRPRQQRPSSATAQHGPRGELVRRRDQHGVRLQALDEEPVSVHRLRNELETEPSDALVLRRV